MNETEVVWDTIREEGRKYLTDEIKEYGCYFNKYRTDQTGNCAGCPFNRLPNSDPCKWPDHNKSYDMLNKTDMKELKEAIILGMSLDIIDVTKIIKEAKDGQRKK